MTSHSSFYNHTHVQVAAECGHQIADCGCPATVHKELRVIQGICAVCDPAGSFDPLRDELGKPIRLFERPTVGPTEDTPAGGVVLL